MEEVGRHLAIVSDSLRPTVGYISEVVEAMMYCSAKATHGIKCDLSDRYEERAS